MPLAQREHGHALRQPRSDERPGRLGEEDLPSSALGADAGGADDVQADVSLLVERGLTGMKTDAHADALSAGPSRRGVDALCLDGGCNGVAGAREDVEERVALRVHLDTVERAERGADHLPMGAQDLGILVTESLEELCRVLDVREDERDRSLWQIGHDAIVRR